MIFLKNILGGVFLKAKQIRGEEPVFSLILPTFLLKLSRWRALGRGALLLAGLCASSLASAADDIRQLAPGIWRVAAGQATAATTGIIATGRGVIVVDPGPNRRRGLAIAAIARRLTHEPVRWVIDTHAHPENVLANAAFPGAEIIASARTAQLMTQRCPICRQRLTSELGAAAMAGTRIRLPTRQVVDGELLQLGRRQLRFQVFSQGHIEGNLALTVIDAGVLFAGGLANDRLVPQMRDASLAGWVEALAALQASEPRQVVPGHGMATGPRVLADFSAYLLALRDACDDDIRRLGQAASASARIGLPQFAGWQRYAEQHPLNVGHAYREREDALLSADMPADIPPK
jgi:glyoxylase-like metal-dependent hydrolase (beta-lactamase superfamily II)